MSTQTTQPVVVYPNTVTNQLSPPSSHSNGSFGAVFIVLAVIIVVSAIACFLGRLCNRRFTQAKPHKHHQNPSFGPKERGRERDIEFGFEPSKRMPAVRPVGNGEPRGLKVHENGNVRVEPRPADDGEQLKAGA